MDGVSGRSILPSLRARLRRYGTPASLLIALIVLPRLRSYLLALARLLARLSSRSLVAPRHPVRKDFLSAARGALGAGAPAAELSAGGSEGGGKGWGRGVSASTALCSPSRFSDLGAVLPGWLAEGLRQGGFDGMKPIQSRVLPLALAGRDVAGIAPTGSGKTLAFLVPALVHAAGQPRPRKPTDGPLALVLAPTRELALQIFTVAEGLLQPSRGQWQSRERGGGDGDRGLHATVVYGGTRRTDQLQALRLQQGVHLMVATPGRLLDFIQMEAFGLSRVSFFVLDEGDRMLDDGFGPDVAAIASRTRPDRQVLFFSATWPPEVEAAARQLCARGQTFERVRAQPEGREGSEGSAAMPAQAGSPCAGVALPPREIRQVVEVVRTRWEHWSREAAMQRKLPLLVRHLEGALGGELGETPGKALIFVSRRLDAEELGATVARRFGLERCGVMHGKRTQEQREAALRAFRQGRVRALVTTDVLGRGVDIADVSHVIIFDFPSDIETYVHRVGRTGRNGRQGTSVAIFEPQPWYPELARELAAVLRACGQEPPPELEEESRGGAEAAAPAWAAADRELPPLEAGPPAASAEELGEWHAGGARVWGYSANGGATEQGRLELRAGGQLRTSWGWGQWALVEPAPRCPAPSRPCPAAAPAATEATTPKAPKAAPSQSAPAARHLELSWNGVTDVVALDSTGLAFELVSRNGRPASAFRNSTRGRALPGTSL